MRCHGRVACSSPTSTPASGRRSCCRGQSCSRRRKTVDGRRQVLRVALALLLAGCGGELASPAIGFTYNWGDEAFAQFMRDEIARTRPEGGVAIRLVTVDSGGWAALGATPLVAEIARARRIAEDSTVVAVIGPGCSREAMQVGPTYRDARVMQLVPTATRRLLGSLG